MSAYTERYTRTSLAEKLGLVDSYGITGLGVILSIAGVIGLVFAIVFCSVVYGGRAYGRTACRNWGSQSNIATKFVVLNWADSGQCLARTPSGQWVKNSQWVAYVRGTK